jgi:hypothetical protein
MNFDEKNEGVNFLYAEKKQSVQEKPFSTGEAGQQNFNIYNRR